MRSSSSIPEIQPTTSYDIEVAVAGPGDGGAIVTPDVVKLELQIAAVLLPLYAVIWLRIGLRIEGVSVRHQDVGVAVTIEFGGGTPWQEPQYSLIIPMTASTDGGSPPTVSAAAQLSAATTKTRTRSGLRRRSFRITEPLYWITGDRGSRSLAHAGPGRDCGNTCDPGFLR